MTLDRGAGAYRIGDKVWLRASSQTTKGMWLGDGDFVTVDVDSTPMVKGETVIEVLSRSRDGLEHPVRREDIQARARHMYRTLGVKSQSGLQEVAKYCALRETSGTITFWPTTSQDRGDGFEFLPNRAIIVEGSDADKLGEALDECFRRCL